jgi:Protein kinase domain
MHSGNFLIRNSNDSMSHISYLFDQSPPPARSMSTLLFSDHQEGAGLSALEFLPSEERSALLANSLLEKIETLMSQPAPRVQSLQFCSMKHPNVLTRLIKAKDSLPHQIKSRYLQVQYALFLTNAHWGDYQKAAQQYICQQYPTHKTQEILQWITPLENFIEGQQGARFSKKNTNRPYTEIRGVTGRIYELLNTPAAKDFPALHQILPTQKHLFPHSRLILGAGGEGVVRMAREIDSQAFFAVKKNKRIHCAEREAAQLHLINDPRYFISLEDAIIVEGSRGVHKAYHLMPYFQMDGLHYINAVGRNQLRVNQKQREIWVREAATKMVDAVCALHALNKYHRDIKPENFLVTVKPGTLSPEKVVLSDLSFVNTTRFTSEKWGTRRYMPPEVFEAHWHDSLSHDAFSLGLTLHQLYYALYGTYELDGVSMGVTPVNGSIEIDCSIAVDGSTLAHIIYLLSAKDESRRYQPEEVRMLPYFPPPIHSNGLHLLADIIEDAMEDVSHA